MLSACNSFFCQNAELIIIGSISYLLYDFVFSGSLFSNKKILTIHEASDKIVKKINIIYEKHPEDVFLIIFSDVLEKKSKLRNFFESEKNTICIPCYLDSEKDLELMMVQVI